MHINPRLWLSDLRPREVPARGHAARKCEVRISVWSWQPEAGWWLPSLGVKKPGQRSWTKAWTGELSVS